MLDERANTRSSPRKSGSEYKLKLLSVENHGTVDARLRPRYTLEVGIYVYPRGSAAVRGYTVDISESGISAMLRDEVPLGEVVRLEFTVSSGQVEAHALVRQRNAFRYGFEFLEDRASQDLINRTCRELAIEQSVSKPHP
jgi:hypothetical protein